MKKIIIVLVAVLVVLGAAGGGAYFYFFKMNHHEKTVTAPPPKPIIFAQLTNLVVSVPANSSNPSNQAFIQLSVQFSTVDPKAIDSFNNLLPIIQSEVVSLLMKKTAAQLMDPSTHNQLSLDLLSIANDVLNKKQDFKPKNPFSAAYITNIVQQG